LDEQLDIKLGRFNPGEDFNSFPCDFQTLRFAVRRSATGLVMSGTTGPYRNGACA